MPQVEQLPSIDWNDEVLNQLPVSHRTPRFISWMKGMVNGSAGWSNKNFWNYCYGDLLSSVFGTGTIYNLNDTVVTTFGVYISTSNTNNGNNPDKAQTYSSLSTYIVGNCVIFGGTIENPIFWICKTAVVSPELFDITKWTKSLSYVWYKISPSYIGAQERCQYNAQKMVMTLALNRTFRTVFRNPASIIAGGYLPLSDIYIETIPFSYASFGVTSIGQDYASITSVSTIWGVTSTSITVLDTTYRFKVWIPLYLSISLGTSYVDIVSFFVKKWRLAGTIFEVGTY